jgi:hypothetical protein
MLLAYEDLLAEPRQTLRDVLDRVGSAAPTPDFATLQTGVPIQGNRLIRAPVVELKPSQARGAERSAITTLLQLPWRAVFGSLGPRAARATETKSGHRDSARLEPR